MCESMSINSACLCINTTTSYPIHFPVEFEDVMFGNSLTNKRLYSTEWYIKCGIA